jgi:Zn-dependent protease
VFRFNIGPIPVTVHWFFFLLIAFLGGALHIQSQADFQYMLIFMLAAFVSITVHELGHAIVGLRCGAPYAEIMLYGLGGIARFPGARLSRWQTILMTAAGPGAGFVLAAISYGLWQAFSTEELVHTGLYTFAQVSLIINLFWSIFNLFPILPLDGGQIVREFLGPKRIKVTCIISFVFVAVLGAAVFYLTQSVFNLLLFVFFGSHTWQVWQHARKG